MRQCQQIRMARVKLADRERALVHGPPHGTMVDMPGGCGHRLVPLHMQNLEMQNPFAASLNAIENTPTHQHLTVRVRLATKLLPRVGTLDAVQEAYDVLRHAISQHPTDLLDLRHALPGLMLRLDLDQECYDFIKGWAAYNAHARGNSRPQGIFPHLTLRGADVLENVDFLDTTACHHVIAALQLKLKLLVDIRDLKVMRKITSRSRVTAEVAKNLESAVIRSPLSTRFLGQSPELLAQTEKTLLRQIRELGATMHEWNPVYIERLFSPERTLSKNLNPRHIWAQTEEEEMDAMQHSYAAWWETEGVLDLMSDARVCAERDLRHGLKERMEKEQMLMMSEEDLVNQEMIHQEYMQAIMTQTGNYTAEDQASFTQAHMMAMEQFMQPQSLAGEGMIEGQDTIEGQNTIDEEGDSSPVDQDEMLINLELHYQGLHRIWDYLSWAVDNASWLGPWSERPSERRTRAAEAARQRAMEEESGNSGSVEEEWADD